MLALEIRIKGRLDEDWSTWFEGFKITYSENQSETVFTGCLADQTALYGMLAKLRDLGLSLVSVKQSSSAQEGSGGSGEGKTDDPDFGDDYGTTEAS